jgi:hypothetical protein
MRMNEWNRHALFLSWNGRNRYLHSSLLKIWDFFHSWEKFSVFVKRRNFSHSWKKSQIFNRDSCKNLLFFWEFSSWNGKNNIKREKTFFFQKGVGVGLCSYKPLWFRQYIYFIDIPSRISNGDKSEKGYFSYILHFISILNINIVGGSKMLWTNISAIKPFIN